MDREEIDNVEVLFITALDTLKPLHTEHTMLYVHVQYSMDNIHGTTMQAHLLSQTLLFELTTLECLDCLWIHLSQIAEM